MKIVILDGYSVNPGDLSWAELESCGELTVYDRTAADEVAARAKEADAVLTNKVVISAGIMDRLPKLKYIGVLATGYNVVDTEAAAKHGITVTNVPAYSTDSVVQMTFAHILNMTNRVAHYARLNRKGKWSSSPDFCYWDTPLGELAGKTLGVVGLGNIGYKVACMARDFGMDVFGAAFATVLAQLLAGLGCLVRLCRGFPVLRTRREDWHWDWRRVGRLCAMGLPMGLQYSITAIGSIVLQAAVNDLGTVYITAVTAGSKVSMFLCCPYDAMGAVMATYGGQNVGARQWDRLYSGLRACSILGVAYSAAAFGLVLAAGDWLNALFLDQESMVLLPLVQRVLVLQAAFYIPLAFVNIVRFLIQGMGFPPIATLAGVLEMAGRTAMAMAVPVLGFSAACLASPAAWILADLFLFPAYFLCHRRLRAAAPLPAAC